MRTACEAGAAWNQIGFEEKGGCGMKVERGWLPEEEIVTGRGLNLSLSAIVGLQLTINPAEYSRCMLSRR